MSQPPRRRRTQSLQQQNDAYQQPSPAAPSYDDYDEYDEPQRRPGARYQQGQAMDDAYGDGGADYSPREPYRQPDRQTAPPRRRNDDDDNYSRVPYHPPINVIVNNTNTNTNLNGGAGDPYGESYFDGGLLQQIGWSVLGFLITVISLGFCYPWAMCMQYGWKINHTVINGRRLQFTGNAFGLFGHWVKWLILTILTVGIYGLWVGIRLEQWKTMHTHFR